MAGEKPAARLTDMHVCPLVTGPVPHVGGPVIAPCTPTVLIGSLPAARMSDMLVCVGPPDIIVQGSMTVLIGGMPAARMGDMTAHGGVLVMGYPTVLIGDAGGGSVGGAGSGGSGAGGGGAGLLPQTAAPAGGGAAAGATDPTVSPLIDKSPTLKKQVDDLKKDGWKIQYWDGPGSDCNKSSKVIRLDKSLKTDSKRQVQTLAHEVGHAQYAGRPDASSRRTYIDSNLQDEGAATLNNIKVQREIKAAGGEDIGIAGNPANATKYNDAYDASLKDSDAVKAQKAMGAVFGDGETTSTTGQTYKDYYGSAYDTIYGPRNP